MSVHLQRQQQLERKLDCFLVAVPQERKSALKLVNTEPEGVSWEY